MTPKEYCILRKLTGVAFAKRVGTTKFTASRLIRYTPAQRRRKKLQISAELAVQIHNRTRGQIGLHELRPDLWPPPEKQSTASVALFATERQPEQTAPAMQAAAEGEGR